MLREECLTCAVKRCASSNKCSSVSKMFSVTNCSKLWASCVKYFDRLLSLASIQLYSTHANCMQSLQSFHVSSQSICDLDMKHEGKPDILGLQTLQFWFEDVAVSRYLLHFYHLGYRQPSTYPYSVAVNCNTGLAVAMLELGPHASFGASDQVQNDVWGLALPERIFPLDTKATPLYNLLFGTGSVRTSLPPRPK